MQMLMPRTRIIHKSFPFLELLMCWLESNLAVLAAEGIADSEARDTILVWLGHALIQEGLGRITPLLSVHAHNSKASAVVQVVVKSDALGEVRAGVKSARALVVIETGSKGVFEHPIRAGFGPVQTLCGTIASRFDAILEVEVDHGHDTSDIDTFEVADTSSILGWGLEFRELVLRDLALADRPVIVLVGGGEDVDVRVGIIIAVADAEGASEHTGGDGQDGENSGS